MTLIRRIGGQAAIYGLGYGFSRILGFALLPVYTRHLSSAEYGVLSILVVTGQIAMILSEVGLGAAMFREVIYRETDRRTVESTTALFPAMMDRMTVLYADAYTVDELESIVAFFKSPAGRSMTAKNEQLVAKMVPVLTTEFTGKLQRDMIDRLCTKLSCTAKQKAELVKRVEAAGGF